MLKTKISSLYWVYTLFNTAKSLVSIMGPIYLHRLGFSFQVIIGFFILTAFVKVAVLPVVFKLVALFGTKPLMCLGVAWMAGHFICYGTLSAHNSKLLPLAATLGLANACFYPSFRIAFSDAGQKIAAGSQASLLSTLTLGFGALAPVIGGVTATQFSPSVAYVLPLLLLVGAFIITTLSRNTFYQQFCMRKVPFRASIRHYYANAAYSFSGLPDMLVWPLFMAILVPSYAMLGVYAGALVVLAAVIQLWTGKMSDAQGEGEYMLAGVSLDVIYNSLRLLVTSLPQVLGLSVMSAVSSSLIAGAYGANFYKNVDDKFKLEYLFGMEMANSITWLVYFPILLALSRLLPYTATLKAGVAITAPATIGMLLATKYFHFKPRLINLLQKTT